MSSTKSGVSGIGSLPPRVQPLIAIDKPQDFTDTIAMMQLAHQGADDIVQPGHRPPQVTTPAQGFLWVKKQFFARPGDLEQEVFLGGVIGVQIRA